MALHACISDPVTSSPAAPSRASLADDACACSCTLCARPATDFGDTGMDGRTVPRWTTSTATTATGRAVSYQQRMSFCGRGAWWWFGDGHHGVRTTTAPSPGPGTGGYAASYYERADGRQRGHSGDSERDADVTPTARYRTHSRRPTGGAPSVYLPGA
jgi:hypothetical protein